MELNNTFLKNAWVKEKVSPQETQKMSAKQIQSKQSKEIINIKADSNKIENRKTTEKICKRKLTSIKIDKV